MGKSGSGGAALLLLTRKRRKLPATLAFSDTFPQADSTSMSGTAQTNRATLNTNLKNNWQTFADGLVDGDSSANLQDFNNATYFLADKVHLTQAGYAIIAAMAKTALNNIGVN